MSVCRNNINVRQPVDGACEQTFIKSSKTASRIKNFIKQDSTYEKWVLTRPFQAKYVETLLSYANLNKQENDPGIVPTRVSDQRIRGKCFRHRECYEN